MVDAISQHYLFYFIRTFAFLFTFQQLREYLKLIGVVLLSLALSVCFFLPKYSVVETSQMVTQPQFVSGMIMECALGFLYALPLAFSLETLLISTRLMEVSRGAHLGEQFVPESGQHRTSIESIVNLFIAFSLVSFTSMHVVLTALYSIPEVSKLEVINSKGLMYSALLLFVGKVYVQAVILALPVMLLNLSIDVVVLLLSRFIGRVNLAFEMLPLKLVVGLTVLVFLVPYLGDSVSEFYLSVVRFQQVLWCG
jgi:flagellar biosynthetic protein FliR